MPRRPLAVALLVLAAAAAPAAASELDGLAFLSWSSSAVVDTLDLDQAGSRDLWLVVLADQAPARFIETVGEWHFGPGLVITGFEVLTGGTPVGSIDLGEHGLATVRIGDFDCRRGGDPFAVARLTVEIDPSRFDGGAATVTPSPVGTRLTFAGYDPIMHCVGVWDMAVIGGITVVVSALPAGHASFGALKAAYR